MSNVAMQDLTPFRIVEVMGDDLGSLYHALWNELAWLYSKWEEYVELFGTKPSRIDLLNKAAGHFFRIVQDSLWEESLLHIARNKSVRLD